VASRLKSDRLASPTRLSLAARPTLKPQRELALERRRIVHFNITEGPSAPWTGQQLVNAFPYDSAPKYVIRDRDKIYRVDFVRRVRAMGIEQLLTAPRSPWQSPYCEHVIGTLRRDCIIATRDTQTDLKSRSHMKSGVSCAHCAPLDLGRRRREIYAARTGSSSMTGPCRSV